MEGNEHELRQREGEGSYCYTSNSENALDVLESELYVDPDDMYDHITGDEQL